MIYFKHLVISFLFLPLVVDSAQLSLELGNSFRRFSNPWNAQSDIHSWVLTSKNVFISSSLVENYGNLASIGFNFQRKSEFTPILRVGLGYLENPDKVYLSGHWQADGFLGFRYKNFNIGWRHISNCKHICRKFITKKGPNIGVDWVVVGFTFGFGRGD